jgi:hypothetical protein
MPRRGRGISLNRRAIKILISSIMASSSFSFIKAFEEIQNIHNKHL